MRQKLHFSQFLAKYPGTKQFTHSPLSWKNWWCSLSRIPLNWLYWESQCLSWQAGHSFSFLSFLFYPCTANDLASLFCLPTIFERGAFCMPWILPKIGWLATSILHPRSLLYPSSSDLSVAFGISHLHDCATLALTVCNFLQAVWIFKAFRIIDLL